MKCDEFSRVLTSQFIIQGVRLGDVLKNSLVWLQSFYGVAQTLRRCVPNLNTFLDWEPMFGWLGVDLKIHSIKTCA